MNARTTTRVVLLMMSAVLLIIGAGCAGKKVTRLETDTTVDLSGRWNDADSRLVAETMIGTWNTTTPWLTTFLRDRGRNPVIIAGSIINRTHEHIATRTFLKDIQRAMLLSGMVDVVADKLERDQVRDERLDQIENANPETVKQLGMELGADFMLTGEMNDIRDQEDGEEVVFYQVDLQLVDIETNRIVWPGQHKIKKYVGKARLKP